MGIMSMTSGNKSNVVLFSWLSIVTIAMSVFFIWYFFIKEDDSSSKPESNKQAAPGKPQQVAPGQPQPAVPGQPQQVAPGQPQVRPRQVAQANQQLLAQQHTTTGGITGITTSRTSRRPTSCCSISFRLKVQ